MSEYTQYPDEIVMSTSIGEAKLAITDANHIHISADIVKVRGKELRASLHVNDYGCGVGYEPSREQSCPASSYHSLYATKVGSFGNSATDAQRTAIFAAWVPAINGFMAAHPELRQVAAEADKNNSALSIEKEIAELEQKIASKRAELVKVLANGRNPAGVVQFPCCKGYGVANSARVHVCGTPDWRADTVSLAVGLEFHHNGNR